MRCAVCGLVGTWYVTISGRHWIPEWHPVCDVHREAHEKVYGSRHRQKSASSSTPLKLSNDSFFDPPWLSEISKPEHKEEPMNSMKLEQGPRLELKQDKEAPEILMSDAILAVLEAKNVIGSSELQDTVSKKYGKKRGSVSATLTHMVRKGRIFRQKDDSGTYVYASSKGLLASPEAVCDTPDTVIPPAAKRRQSMVAAPKKREKRVESDLWVPVELSASSDETRVLSSLILDLADLMGLPDPPSTLNRHEACVFRLAMINGMLRQDKRK
jgi:hypothetical protein